MFDCHGRNIYYYTFAAIRMATSQLLERQRRKLALINFKLCFKTASNVDIWKAHLDDLLRQTRMIEVDVAMDASRARKSSVEGQIAANLQMHILVGH